ncbi:hypothetical protein CBL_03065 [Carabus blaptoides fortunei]
MDFTADNRSSSQHTNTIRRSASSLNVTFMNPICAVRESHSFTDGMNTLQRKMQNIDLHSNTHDSSVSFDDTDHENDKKHIWTRQIFSYEPYFVHEKMLHFQGRVYSPADIARFWKKDCRTWLWKNMAVKEKRIKIRKVKRNMKRIDRLTKLFSRLSLTEIQRARKLKRKRHNPNIKF